MDGKESDARHGVGAAPVKELAQHWVQCRLLFLDIRPNTSIDWLIGDRLRFCYSSHNLSPFALLGPAHPRLPPSIPTPVSVSMGHSFMLFGPFLFFPPWIPSPPFPLATVSLFFKCRSTSWRKCILLCLSIIMGLNIISKRDYSKRPFLCQSGFLHWHSLGFGK